MLIDRRLTKTNTVISCVTGGCTVHFCLSILLLLILIGCKYNNFFYKKGNMRIFLSLPNRQHQKRLPFRTAFFASFVMLNLFQHPLFISGDCGSRLPPLFILLTPVNIMRMQKLMRQMSARFAEIVFVNRGNGRIEVRLTDCTALVFGINGF